MAIRQTTNTHTYKKPTTTTTNKQQQRQQQKKTQKHNMPSPYLSSCNVAEDSIRGKDSSSQKSLSLLISRWQNTSMTGWLWATRTLRNPRYATKAARNNSCLDCVFNRFFAVCSRFNAKRFSVDDDNYNDSVIHLKRVKKVVVK